MFNTMNVYQTEFSLACPVNGERIRYSLQIWSDEMILVETISEAIFNLGTQGYHEEVAHALSALGGRQCLKAYHHGVWITTYR